MADVPEIEALVAHPVIHPMITPDGAPAVDVKSYLTEPNIGLMMSGGCFLGVWNGLGRFECHTLFEPGARGRNAIVEARKALEYVFLHTHCHEVATKVPGHNLAAAHFTNLMGFRMLFERRDAWMSNGIALPIRYYQLGIDDWIVQGPCIKEGVKFHEALKQLLPSHDQHAEDRIHDCYVGATFELIRAGYVDKAILFYNRWAMLAGYQPIEKISDDPLELDLKEFVITVREGDFSVRSTCQP